MEELPPLPDRIEPEALRDLDDAGLAAVLDAVRAAERATVAAMSPWQRQLRELQVRAQEVATEQRRRERAAHIAQRRAVREQAASGDMPSLETVLAAEPSPLPEDLALRTARAFLATGGEVGFGYASRPGTLAFTDGRRQQAAATVGEARHLYAEGWEPGAPGVPGVRVHLAGTRVERVVQLSEVVLEKGGATGS